MEVISACICMTCVFSAPLVWHRIRPKRRFRQYIFSDWCGFSVIISAVFLNLMNAIDGILTATKNGDTKSPMFSDLVKYSTILFYFNMTVIPLHGIYVYRQLSPSEYVKDIGSFIYLIFIPYILNPVMLIISILLFILADNIGYDEKNPYLRFFFINSAGGLMLTYSCWIGLKHLSLTTETDKELQKLIDALSILEKSKTPISPNHTATVLSGKRATRNMMLKTKLKRLVGFLFLFGLVSIVLSGIGEFVYRDHINVIYKLVFSAVTIIEFMTELLGVIFLSGKKAIDDDTLLLSSMLSNQSPHKHGTSSATPSEIKLFERDTRLASSQQYHADDDG